MSHKFKNYLIAIASAIASAITLTLIGCYSYMLSTSAYDAIVLFFIFMLVLGVATPTMGTQALARFDKIRGVAGALFSTITLTITAISCNIVGILPDRGLDLLGLTFIVLGALSIVVVSILAKSDN
jgi:hypothetical protein